MLVRWICYSYGENTSSLNKTILLYGNGLKNTQHNIQSLFIHTSTMIKLKKKN